MTDRNQPSISTGTRLQSQVCDTSIIVIRPASRDVVLLCGGAPMVPLGNAPDGTHTLSAPYDTGTQIGKRYTHPEDDALEILVTSQGAGALSDDETFLIPKQAKPLPSSD